MTSPGSLVLFIVPCKGRIFPHAPFAKARAMKNNCSSHLGCLNGRYGTDSYFLVARSISLISSATLQQMQYSILLVPLPVLIKNFYTILKETGANFRCKFFTTELLWLDVVRDSNQQKPLALCSFFIHCDSWNGMTVILLVGWWWIEMVWTRWAYADLVKSCMMMRVVGIRQTGRPGNVSSTWKMPNCSLLELLPMSAVRMYKLVASPIYKSDLHYVGY